MFGLVDVNVAVLTAARLVGVSVDATSAAFAILIALAVNAAARMAYAWFAGPVVYAARLSTATCAALAVAVGVLALAGIG